MPTKLIKTEADYDKALARLEEIFEAEPGTPEGDEAELLTTLIELYEDKAFPMELPDPIEAIKFRMEQEGLNKKDMEQYLGSASKVSEVLSGKRQLSLAMIRKLVAGLGIPAEVLLKEPGADLPPDSTANLTLNFPLAEMLKRGWFDGFTGKLSDAKAQAEELVSGFINTMGGNALMPAFNRQNVREGGHQDAYALMAWRIRVAALAMAEKLPKYKQGSITPEFLRSLASLSYLDNGPLLAKEYLNKSGIHLVCERHMPKTHLDGGAIKLPTGAPLVALTLRYDRVDNFWFVLFHELAHVHLHLYANGNDAFLDDLMAEDTGEYEQQADEFAANGLIPAAEWSAAELKAESSSEEVTAFAEKLRISPAIPAGRLRYEAKDYKLFKDLMGEVKPRTLFAIK